MKDLARVARGCYRHMPRLSRCLYGVLLKVYPPEFQKEFGAELKGVFGQALDAAAERGCLEITAVCVRELRDWPLAVIRAHLRETKEADMAKPMRITTGDERISWLVALAGLWPFLLAGPANVLLNYPYPLPAWRSTPWAQILMGTVYGLPLLMGLSIGWLRKWPRWAYPYLAVVVFILGSLVSGAITGLVFEVGPEWPYWPQFAITTGSHALVLGALALSARAWRPLQPLYQSFRRDWTQLSFGLFLSAGVLFGSIDHEEDPRLTLFVLLPPLIILLGAMAYLLSASKAQRILAMLISLVLAVGVRVADGKLFYGEYALQMAAIISIPALLEFLPPLDPSRTGLPRPIEP
jgi:hypothetical protein